MAATGAPTRRLEVAVILEPAVLRLNLVVVLEAVATVKVRTLLQILMELTVHKVVAEVALARSHQVKAEMVAQAS